LRYGYPGKLGKIPDILTNSTHSLVNIGYALTVFNADVTGKSFLSGIDLLHPALEEGGFPGLTGSVENPIELVPDIAVKLGAHEAFLRGQHVVIFRVTGAGGIKETSCTHSIVSIEEEWKNRKP
jgi:hypothetical protein